MTAEERKAHLRRLMAEVELEFTEANVVSLMISDDDIPYQHGHRCRQRSVVYGQFRKSHQRRRWVRHLEGTSSCLSVNTRPKSVSMKDLTSMLDPRRTSFYAHLVLQRVWSCLQGEDIQIESIQRLIPIPTGDVHGQFRNMGICEINDDNAAEFFCSLSNQ
jgi:hypothetical protein